MKLVTFTHDGVTRVGKLVDDRVIDLTAVNPPAYASAALQTDMVALLSRGESALSAIKAIGLDGNLSFSLNEVKLEAPVQMPGKFLAIGMNYQDHVEEAARKGIKTPDTQIWFNKQTSCITGPYDPVYNPAISTMLDYEIELCVVIGKKCRHVAEADALSVVGGYTVTNDFSVRDVQWASPTWTLGKSFDSHGPLGPWLVTADEVPDPQSLQLSLYVNGEIRQENNTGLMVYTIRQQIAHLTKIMTLHPGDLIATGTPMGVAAGMEPPKYLKDGDVVRAEIEKIGFIENRIVPELY
jgi:2-keto-4-pentenoate hydratase/2-oxohepta-3-ene-1,7-dioic acid hydratase in catechol pathway